jgi:hypothetical protein
MPSRDHFLMSIDPRAREAGGEAGGACVCAVCGAAATSRCARCRGVWYCGPKCQRAAWGAHKLDCAAAVAAAARGGGVGAREAGGSGGGGGGVAAVAACESNAGGTGGLPAATLREIASAVALLGSRKPQGRAAGARALVRIAKHDVGAKSNRKLVEFQEAVVAAGGIPLIVRALEADETGSADAAMLAHFLTAYNSEMLAVIAAAGVIPPLTSLLASPSLAVQAAAAGALSNLGMNAGNKVVIASAGAIPPLVALLCSTSVGVLEYTAGALCNLSRNDENKIAIASAGGIPPLIALLRGPSPVGVLQAATTALMNLSENDAIMAMIASAGGIFPLIALLRSPSVGVPESAAGAVANLSAHAGNGDDRCCRRHFSSYQPPHVAVAWRASECCGRIDQPGYECREHGRDRVGRGGFRRSSRSCGHRRSTCRSALRAHYGTSAIRPRTRPRSRRPAASHASQRCSDLRRRTCRRLLLAPCGACGRVGLRCQPVLPALERVERASDSHRR